MGFGWKRYVPVAERRQKAEKNMQKLAKKGLDIQPVHIQGRTIARTFWGKAWCTHLESFSDFANRLPRGRTYVRNGSVCHLDIREGEVRAKVSGSSMYEVCILIQPLKAADWERIKQSCTGQIQSLLDLLGGRLSDGVMAVVTDRDKGLFPKPREIKLGCSCPDYATMCKHVAAVLYGVGARLDERPELLFTLRGVHHGELVSANVEAAVQAVIEGGRGRRIADSDLADVFGVEIDEAPAPRKPPAAKNRESAADSNQMTAAKKKQAPVSKKRKSTAGSQRSTAQHSTAQQLAAQQEPLPEIITGALVRELREKLGMSGKEFADLMGVSGGVVSVWEHKKGELKLQVHSRKALEKAWRTAGGLRISVP